MRRSRASKQLRLYIQPLQLYFVLADLLEQLSLLAMAFVLGLGLLAPGEQVAGALQQLLLPLAHLNRVHRMVGGNLLERLATTDRLHGDLGLELGAMSAAFAHLWEPPLRGGAPPHRLTMNAVQKSQTTSRDTCLSYVKHLELIEGEA